MSLDTLFVTLQFARRKAKDLPKHESRSSREIDDEAKMDRLPPSRDPRRHDSACTADDITKRETDSGSGKGPHVVKKSAPAVSSATVSSGPSSSNEANEQNFSSMCNSPRNTSDDDTGSIRGRNHRTLPGCCLLKKFFPPNLFFFFSFPLIIQDFLIVSMQLS